MMQLQGGYKDAEHWGPYGFQCLGPRDLPPQLKQMQPTGLDEQGDEGRRRALEAATVARAEGGDWSSIAQYLRESPAAGLLRTEERQLADEMSAPGYTGHRTTPQPFSARYCGYVVYETENVDRIRRAFPTLTVSC
jgi:hypothetical protein